VFATRRYEVVRCDGNTWALEDIGPAPERVHTLVAFRDDSSDELHVTVFPKHTLPFELIEQLLDAVRQDVALRGTPCPTCGWCQAYLTLRRARVSPQRPPATPRQAGT
jgi:hypothetical protein